VSGTEVLVGILAALAEGDARPVRDWLRSQLVDSGGLAAADLDSLAWLAQWNAEEDHAGEEGVHPEGPGREGEDAAGEGGTGEGGTGEEGARHERRVAATIRRAFAAANGLPSAGPLLALYLKFECETAWEVSWHHEPIRLVIRSAVDAWRQLSTKGQAATEAALAALALDCLQIVDLEMAVENAASCATLTRYARCAKQAAAFAARVKMNADRHAGSPIGSYVADIAYREASYYNAVQLAVHAVHRHFTVGDADLSTAIRVLAEVEQHELIDEIDRSELRAHRYNLEALRAVADQPWLQVDHGKVVYMYPFGLRGAAPEDLVQVLRRHGQGWTLGGLATAAVVPNLLLNDIWKGDDPLERQYRGAAVRLPSLLVPDPDGAGEPLTMDVELRLSELGNHYLRIECELAGAAPHRVYAAMLRAAPEFGDLAELGYPIRPASVGHAETPEWGQLAEFAEAVIGDLAGQLNQHGGVIAASARPGMYHVVISVLRASTRTGGDGPVEPLVAPATLIQTPGGEPLRHPVRHGVSAIAEWVRYPVAAETVIHAPDFEDDLVIRTGNTTVVAMFGSPSYMVGAVEEAAEFVASLDGLFAGWQDELAGYYKQVRPALLEMTRRLERGRGGRRPASATVADRERTVEFLLQSQELFERQQLRLHAFIMASRSTLIFIASPSLVTSPVIRLILDRLLDAAEFHRLRSEFVVTVEEVLGDRLGTVIAALVRRRQERDAEEAQLRQAELERAAKAEAERREREARAEAEREEQAERRQRQRIDTILAAVAAVGISGVIQVVQSGFELKGIVTYLLVAMVVLVAVGFGLLFHTIFGRHPPAIVEPAAPPAGGAEQETG